MEIQGKIVQILPEQGGQGKNGPWKKQDFILETPGQYPKKVCVTIWGDKIDKFALKSGDEVTFSIDVESREYNGRWYTDVKAWNAVKGSGGAPNSEPPASHSDAPFPSQAPANWEEVDDDLPF